jgi:predicted nucleic acid-binding protein
MTFADTSYFLALLNPDDKWLAAARKASAGLKR